MRAQNNVLPSLGEFLNQLQYFGRHLRIERTRRFIQK